MSEQMKCPKCKEGIMRLPLALKPLEPGELERRKEGTKLECSKCGYRAAPHEVYPPKKSK